MIKFLRLTMMSAFFALCLSAAAQKAITMSREALLDKVKGGWAGQTIGVTFGGPYEFRFQGTFIQNYQPLLWYDGYLKKTMLEVPGLYDDLYMDLTFVDVIEKYGLDAPVDSFANAFAHAGYMLWHANQAARYNILNGIHAPLSGYWKNNPHADDIDYQIESDFAGLMCPGMPNAAAAISDKVGHIMNYGDGWYGGVYVGALYANAFIIRDVTRVVTEALKTIPARSTFYQCISDVVAWHKKYPNDWRSAWFEIQKKWSSDVGCADGVFNAFDIDAKINSAYVTLGLLYGKGDFGKSIEIATRAGQDADCNPSTVGGILGTMLGYSEIPAYWKMGLKEAEDIDFKYTTMSLNKVYEIGFKHTLHTIERNGGRIMGDRVLIRTQVPKAVRLEQSFPNMYPVAKIAVSRSATDTLHIDFSGTGIVLRGEARLKAGGGPEYVFQAEFYIDGVKVETAALPTSFTVRRHELFWKYGLPNGNHRLSIRILNPTGLAEVISTDYIIYSDQPPGKHSRNSPKI